MPHRSVRIVMIVLLLGLIQLVIATSASAADRYIVVLHDGASPNAAAARHGTTPHKVFSHALRGYAATMSRSQVAAARRDPSVLFVSRDVVVSLAKPRAKPGGGSTTPPAQQTPTGIRRIGQLATRYNTLGDDGISTAIDVAVVDTGIDAGHSDLNVVGGYNCSSGASYRDGNGHGTHVAGTIGARDNATGVVGVAPNVRLHAVRVLNNAGSGSTSSVICGLDWVAANPAIDVLNLSLGGAGSDGGNCGVTTNDAMHKAICRVVAKGVTVVAAAGNEAANAATSTPAAYDEVITVSAWADFDGVAGGMFSAVGCRADEDDSFANFSNFGADVDLSAPGVCILSTWTNGGYNTISGTSMASPHVAGAAALYLSTHPGASAATVRASLLANRTFPAVSDDRDTTWEGLLSVTGW